MADETENLFETSVPSEIVSLATQDLVQPGNVSHPKSLDHNSNGSSLSIGSIVATGGDSVSARQEEQTRCRVIV